MFFSNVVPVFHHLENEIYMTIKKFIFIFPFWREVELHVNKPKKTNRKEATLPSPQVSNPFKNNFTLL